MELAIGFVLIILLGAIVSGVIGAFLGGSVNKGVVPGAGIEPSPKPMFIMIFNQVFLWARPSARPSVKSLTR